MIANPAALRVFAERYAAAWCGQNAASVAAFYETTGSLTVNGGEPAAGRDSITAVAQSFMTDFPDMRVILDDIRIVDSRAQFHWTLISAARRVRISGYEEWRFGASGLIAESQGHFDHAEYQRQLEAGER
jgi:hypothetical protein